MKTNLVIAVLVVALIAVTFGTFCTGLDNVELQKELANPWHSSDWSECSISYTYDTIVTPDGETLVTTSLYCTDVGHIRINYDVVTNEELEALNN